MSKIIHFIKYTAPRLPLINSIYHKYLCIHRKKGIIEELKVLKKEAETNFSTLSPKNGNFEDYNSALQSHWVSYSEYMYQYEFWNLSENDRKEYVSRLQMQAFYRLMIPETIEMLFWDKKQFLNYFKKYIHRQWLDVNKSSYSGFYNLLSNKDCIVKPGDSCCGRGIYKLYSKDISNYDKTCFDDLKKQNAIVEECIIGCEELQSFHPHSLNTIRVVTILHNGKHDVLHAFFRVGTGGNVVDNAHAGGLFSQIDVNTGELVSDGITVDGKLCEKHPDSKIKFKGFIIPKWDEIKKIVVDAATSLPDLFICGWDVTITDKYEIEIIEGNHGPDFDVMQSPLKKGYYSRINDDIKNYYKKDLATIISI